MDGVGDPGAEGCGEPLGLTFGVAAGEAAAGRVLAIEVAPDADSK